MLVDEIRRVDPAIPDRAIADANPIPEGAMFFADLEMKVAEVGTIGVADGTDLFPEFDLAVSAYHVVEVGVK